jgi:hypothetical protein
MAVSKEGARNQVIEGRILEMFGLLKNLTENIPKFVGYTWEGGMAPGDRPIQFQDALGRNMCIPLMFCSSQEVSNLPSIQSLNLISLTSHRYSMMYL